MADTIVQWNEMAVKKSNEANVERRLSQKVQSGYSFWPFSYLSEKSQNIDHHQCSRQCLLKEPLVSCQCPPPLVVSPTFFHKSFASDPPPSWLAYLAAVLLGSPGQCVDEWGRIHATISRVVQPSDDHFGIEKREDRMCFCRIDYSGVNLEAVSCCGQSSVFVQPFLQSNNKNQLEKSEKSSEAA